MKLKIDEVITLDFETYYDQVYSLRSSVYNTSEYIRDPQFLAQCVGIKRGKRKAKWYGPDEVRRELTENIDWERSHLLAHNTAFDGFILSHHYGVVLQTDRLYLDTMSMTRGLHNEMSRASLNKISKFYGIGEKHVGALDDVKGIRVPPPDSLKKLGLYCANDVELCFEVFSKQVGVYPEDEIRLIDLTMRMFIDPVLLVDVPRAQAEHAREVLRRLHTIQVSGASIEELSSNAKFAALLKKCGIEPPTKVSLKTGQEIFAFAQSDPEFTDLADSDNLKVAQLVQARLIAKSTIGETRAKRFVQCGSDGKKLPVMLNYFGAKCVTEDVEVLTHSGWTSIKEWDESNFIAQVDEQRNISFLPAKKFIGPVEENWISSSARYLPADFTLGHKMPYLQHENFAWKVMQAGDAMERKTFYAPLSGSLTDSGAITPEQMRVLVMVQADGCYSTDTKTGTGLRIALKKTRKIARARQLLQKANVVFRECEYPSTPGYTYFKVSKKDYPTWMTVERKFFGSWLLDSTSEAREALIQELTHWDGWIHAKQHCYSSSEKINADWVVTLCHLTGRSASISKKERGDGRRANYSVAIRQRGHCLIRQRHLSLVNNPRATYCTVTETGFWLARRGDRIFVTGNTGRWSGGNSMNMQNLPRQEYDDVTGALVPETGELRKSIIAPRSNKIVVCDSAQIEARVNAWLAGQADLLEVFRTGGDPYSAFASEVYGREITKKDKTERFVGKVATLGLGFQMGAPKFQTTLAIGMMGPPVEISDKLARSTVAKYRKQNKFIANQWAAMQSILYAMFQRKSGEYRGVLEYDGTSIWMPNGMGLHYPGLTADIDIPNDRVTGFRYSSHGIWKKIYGGLLTENVVQALARVIVGEQMLQIAEKYRVVMMTHDEVVCVVPNKQADRCLEDMLAIMKTPPAWCSDIPLGAEGGYDVCYSK